MIYVFLAEGFEEIEALAAVDVLRRARLEVQTVGVGGRKITGSHGITVVCDLVDDVLPGGVPGTPNLEASPVVQRFVDYAAQNGLWLAAICAAPSILGHKGLLDGLEATANPGFQDQLGAARLSGDYVCVDGRFVTARGMGVAVDFGLKLVEVLTDAARAGEIRAALQCRA